LAHFEKESHEDILEYFQFLIDKEYGFLCDNPLSFPDISMDWKAPAHITNIIIDHNADSNYDYQAIFKELTKMGCSAVQFRFFCTVSLEKLHQIHEFLIGTTFRSSEIIVKYSSEFEQVAALIQFCETYQYIQHITIFESSFEQFEQIPHRTVYINYIKENINNESHCGIIHPAYFAINIRTFTESQHHNTCLNRKISIDQNGDIKNCPSMTESYGNIANTTLQEALNHPDFKKYWNITKDQINICKDCEFRHICTDCRAYVENPDDILSKPLKCGYNPYTCEWEDWSANPLKEKAMKHYGMI
jgi:SPASM domain peptide maturase of grasp-with-spasm system